ncbi:basic helix-loop-helix (bHLH) DNA-bindingsuperfamily protein [Striga asiatica]|uniref:Basic helix-loop-helix (BHLH) DNA-bindingsuperfamily protein n=1 Tax=Striga asiatica TaxID=4170 RepID=A0A5A7PFY2_STRAF|nr:basic helix-loop-helix (bHLH) DNA-bindingsuperfamily protein [Striga asiatica]
MSNIMLTSSSSSSQLLIPHENTNNSNPINSTHEYDQTTPYNNPNVDQTITNDPNLAPKIIDFSSWAEENRRSTDDTSEHRSIKRKRVCTSGNRTEVQAQDHLVAEKKRRENLRQLFIGLSKVVPGIKKLDKASLLEDAINHLKSLQERVRVLEEEQIKNGSNATAQLSSAPEIKVRIWNKQVLIKICCENRTGIMSKIPCEIEKINFNVMDMRFMVFGGATLYIIILAEYQSRFYVGPCNDVRGTAPVFPPILTWYQSRFYRAMTYPFFSTYSFIEACF